RAPTSTLFPYTTLFRSGLLQLLEQGFGGDAAAGHRGRVQDVVDALADGAALALAHRARTRSQRQMRRQQLVAGLEQDGALHHVRSEEHTSELQSRGHLV